MADEQTNESLSAAPEPTDGAAAEAPSESSSGPHWWQRLFSRGTDEGGAEAEAPSEPAPSNKLELTEEELQRRVQAEVDRREAKRQAEADRQARRQLRDKDPWAYAEQERQMEATVQTHDQFMGQLHEIGGLHDRATIDVILGALPDAERDRILKLEGAGVGLDGRKLVVSEAIKSLEKHWKNGGQEAAQKSLRNNPAFRKQVLAEMRGSRQTGEPDLLPSSDSTANADRTVSRLLRDYYIGG